jgi:hypothetical protein
MSIDGTPSASVTLRGSLVLLANPCTTQPCLPGVALALAPPADAGGPHPCFLTRHGAFVSDPRALPGGSRAAIGELLEVVGERSERYDVHGEKVVTIEVADVQALPAVSRPDE